MGLKILIESLITLGQTSSQWTRNRVIPDNLLPIICLPSIKSVMGNLLSILIGTLRTISKLSKLRMEEVSLHKLIILVVSWTRPKQIILLSWQKEKFYWIETARPSICILMSRICWCIRENNQKLISIVMMISIEIAYCFTEEKNSK